MSISIDVNGLEDHYQPSQPILELNHVHQGSTEKKRKNYTLCEVSGDQQNLVCEPQKKVILEDN